MNRSVKRVTLILTVAALLTALFAGCAGPSTPTATTPPQQNAPVAAPTVGAGATPVPAGNDNYYNEPGVLPLVKEEITLKIGFPQGQHLNDIYTNYQTRFIQEQTGIKLEFDMFPDPEADYMSKVELMVAAGGKDLPDILIKSFSQSRLMPWAEAGMIIPLTDYYNDLFYWGQETIDTSGGELSKEYIMKYITSYDGNIYGVYSFNSTQNNQYSGSRINIYRPWLQELGLAIPSTTDDFLSTLKTFRDTDLNGSGKKDQIPLSGYKDSVANLRRFLMTPYIYTQNEYWTNYNNKISVSFNTDGWREGLRYAANLYKEGLLDPAHFTQDQAAMTVVCSQDPQVYGAYTRISTSNMAADDLDRYNYDRIEQLTNSQTGETKTSIGPALPNITALVTKNCQYPEAAYMMLDYMTGYDCSIITRYGVEGQEWEYVDLPKTIQAFKDFWAAYPGGNLLEQFFPNATTPPLCGPKYFSSSSWGTMQDTWWGQVGPNVMTENMQNEFGNPLPETERTTAAYVNEFYARKQLVDAMQLRDESMIVAGLIYNAEEQDVITNYYTEIKLYVEETWAAYVVGTMNIEDDAAWANYLKTLDQMGLQRCIDAAQSCFTRMNSN